MSGMTPKNILFLDIDGPIASERSIYAQGYKRDEITGWDAVSCHLINDFATAFRYTIVVSSAWAMYGLEKMQELLSEAGIKAPIHEDWATPRKKTVPRSREINWWLDNHSEVERVIVIDDMRVILKPKPDRYDLVLRVDPSEGFTWKNFMRVYSFEEYEI